MVTVRYQNGNYDFGNQSTLFTFEYAQDSAQYGVLVDSGPGLDLDEQLSGEGRLSATLLTHAHQDHIVSLDTCLRDGAPIYASSETARILKHTLAVDADRLGIEHPDEIIDRLQVLDADWTRLVREVQVRPVPVGHAPGATGFLIQFDDTEHIFVTGDFTQHDVAGNPGLDWTFNGALHSESDRQTMANPETPDDVFSIGTLHLNVPTTDDACAELQTALETAYERTLNGSNTVVTTSSLGGIHMASLLDTLQRDQGTQFDIRLVGKVATVYEALEYEFDRVTSTPELDDMDELLSPGTVTIAGPEDASAGSAERLLEAANRDAGNTAVVQLRSAGTETINAPWLATDTFKYQLHPTEDELEELIEYIDPIQVIVSHTADRSELGRWKDSGRDLETLVWASYGHDRYELFDNGAFLAPTWVEREWGQTVIRQHDSHPAGTVSQNALPAVGHHEISLPQEGIDTDRLFEESETLGRSARPGASQGAAEPVELDAGVYRLAQLAVERDTSLAHNQVSTTEFDTLVLEAVDWFITENLRNEIPKQSTAPTFEESIALSEGTPLAKILGTEAAEDQVATEVLAKLLRDGLAVPDQGPIRYTNPRLSPRSEYMTAITESDDNEFETRSDVVQAALEVTLIPSSPSQ
jgi:putative mRNA 3-end processing factor